MNMQRLLSGPRAVTVRGLVVGAFAIIFALRKTPEVRDLARLRF